MKIKTYGKNNFYGDPSDPESGYSAAELERNLHLVTTDVECPWCGKLQAMLDTVYFGGPCKRCGKLTSGKDRQ